MLEFEQFLGGEHADVAEFAVISGMPVHHALTHPAQGLGQNLG